MRPTTMVQVIGDLFPQEPKKMSTPVLWFLDNNPAKEFNFWQDEVRKCMTGLEMTRASLCQEIPGISQEELGVLIRQYTRESQLMDSWFGLRQ